MEKNNVTTGGVPPTATQPTQPDQTISQLSEQVSQTQQALAQLVELQKQQFEANKPQPEPIAPPEDFDAKDILDPKTPSGEYFANVIREREKRIVSTLEQEFSRKMDERVAQLEAERAMNERLERLAHQKKVDEGKIEEFKKWMNSPDNVNVDVLFDIFSKVSNTSENPPAARMTQAGGTAGAGAASTGFLSGLK